MNVIETIISSLSLLYAPDFLFYAFLYVVNNFVQFNLKLKSRILIRYSTLTNHLYVR